VNNNFDSDDVLQWCSYIAEQHFTGHGSGSIRISSIANELGLTSFPAKVITVVGTNGKGSTVCYLEHIYKAAEYSVGSFTSPDMLRVNERIRLDGFDVSDAELVAAFRLVEKNRASMPLSYFEFLTLAALTIFAAHQLDVILLEVGLGGRLDPVNVVASDLVIVSSIGLDHVEWLGDSRELIAAEKAGVFKPDSQAVVTELDVPETMLQVAAASSTKLHHLSKDFRFNPQVNSWQYISQCQRLDLSLPKLRLDHAAASIFATELLRDDLPVQPEHIETAMKTVMMPGRFELLETVPEVILDVAHNPQATQYLANQLRSKNPPKKLVALVGMRDNKAYKDCLQPLLGLFDSWYCADLKHEDSLKGADIVDYLREQGEAKCYHYTSVELAMDALYSTIEKPEEMALVVFGSFITVRQAKRYFSSGSIG
jgi:dihydrofolate synthase / folylpolyglutamate synthase